MNLTKPALIMVILIALSGSAPALQTDFQKNLILETQDGYEVSLGSIIEGFHGQHNLLVPVTITNEQPVEYVHLILQYDASVVEPTLVAPALFFQRFQYDLLGQGRLEIELECDLAPPPYVPPIPTGTTIIAYVLMDVVVDDLGYDIATVLGYYEDPNTPFPDNLIMLENGFFVIPPQLALTPVDVYIYSPVYGDINLNGYRYEIGDAITFISYLSGYIEFNARQRANSDCNRDGIQATVSDLVYLLNVINGYPDTLLAPAEAIRGPEALAEALNIFAKNPTKILDNYQVYSIFLSVEEPLSGFSFTLETPDCLARVGDITLGRDAGILQLVSNASTGTIKIVGYSSNGKEIPQGKAELIRITFESDCAVSADHFLIEEADFSTGDGRKIDCQYEARLSEPAAERKSGAGGQQAAFSEPTAYPNPFNSNVNIALAIAKAGPVKVEIFDLLGRQVTTLRNSFEQPGRINMNWNGQNNSGEQVAAGLYLCRIKCDQEEKILKLQYLK